MVKLTSLVLSVSLLLPLIGAEESQGIDGLIETLQQHDLNQFAKFLSDCNKPTNAAGQRLFKALATGEGGPYTLFAPEDQAFDKVNQKMLKDPSRLANLLSYHVVHGTFPLDAAAHPNPGPNPHELQPAAAAAEAPFMNQPGMPQGGVIGNMPMQPGVGQGQAHSNGGQQNNEPHGENIPGGGQPIDTTQAFGGRPLGTQPMFTAQVGGVLPTVAMSLDVNPATIVVGRTLMSAGEFVALEGHRAQVLAWSNSTGPDGKPRILNQATDCPIIKCISWKHVVINIIPTVLYIPAALPWTLDYHGLSKFGAALKETTVPGAPSNLLESLNAANGWGAKGFTLFAPDNGAMEHAHDQLKQMSSNNPHAMVSILQNHMINGSTVYSPSLCSPHFEYSIVAQSGMPLVFHTNSSGTWVMLDTHGRGPMFSARITKTEMIAQNGVVHMVDGLFMSTEYNPSAAASAYESAKHIANQYTATETGPVGLPTGGVVGEVVKNVHRNGSRGRAHPGGWDSTTSAVALSVFLGIWFSVGLI